MSPDDLLSIVTFEEQVDVLMPARKVVNKELIKEHLTRIVAGRTTNLFDGIVAGGAQVSSVPATGYLKRMLILTDGEPTTGLKDFPSIVNQIAGLKDKGITVTALGFGPEYNEELLAGMARRGGGNYYYISRPDLLPEVFRKELETLMTVAASNARLTLHLPRWTQIKQVHGYSPEFGPRRLEVALPDMERGATLSILVDTAHDPRPAGAYRTFQAELSFDDAATGGGRRSIRADAVVEFTANPALLHGSEDPLVQQHVELSEASRNLEKTVMGMRTQQISPMTAMMELQKTQQLLLQQGREDEAGEIGKALEELKAGGGGAEKTLVGAVLNLDQGKERAGG
jgi:Ca-activated chloride channel family protein